MAKRNTFKNTEEEEPAKETTKASKKKAKPNGSGFFSKFMRFVRDERTQKVFGLLCILFSIVMAVSFVSFFFSFQFDQSVVGGKDDGEASNWLGKFGAKLSHFFVFNLGIGAFFLIPLTFITGLNFLLREKLFSIGKWYLMSFMAFVWLSTLLGFVAYGTRLDVLGGRFGFGMVNLLYEYVKNIGIALILVFSLVIYLTVAYNMSFGFLKEFWNKLRDWKTKSSEPEEDADVDTSLLNHNKAGIEVLHEDEPDELDRLEAEIRETEGLPRPEEIEFQIADLAPEPTPLETDLQNESPGPAEAAEGTPIPFETERTEDIPREAEILETFPKDDESSQTVLLNTSADTVLSEDNPESSEEFTFTVETGIQEATVEDLEHDSINTTGDAPLGEYDPTLDLPHFRFPTVDLLEEYGSGNITINKAELEENKDKIVNTLKNYSIQIDSIKATVGPTVTLYEIVPAPGVRISKIKNLEDDIALSLSALGIRIIAPIPGRGTIGIEVPNQQPEVVSMKSILTSEKFAKTPFDLPIGLGKTISNETFVADLAKMPHLLMAGATGQGKSVGLNAILVSLLYKKHPAELKFVLVDPKKVELTLFNKIERHYLAKLPGEEEAIITDTKKVVNTLNSLCIEMDNRYELLKAASVRTIKEYNAKFKARRLSPHDGHRFLPYIVLVVDEFADLIMTAGKEVELPIARLAQLARAIGIHLIIATQRPSVNIITGTIKANFPARIAFRVSSKVDSRTILDSGGAEQLIGRGDMLLSSGSDLIRLQCAFVDTPEVEKLTEYIGEQRGYPEAFELPEYEGGDGEGKSDFDVNDKDSLFEDAARMVVMHQQGSASLLQRKLKLGYNRAGRLIDQLESAGIVGPNEGSKARQVLIPDEVSLERFLENMK
jgi:S-DNA-T family DNA segregation ATPase FtsK/SpoIIIE